MTISKLCRVGALQTFKASGSFRTFVTAVLQIYDNTTYVNFDQLLKKQNSLDDDSDDPEMSHYHSIILDALDKMDLMEVDDDPDADQTDPNDDELDEIKTLDATTGPVELPKILTPPPTISKK